jgi:hypothetical protein
VTLSYQPGFHAPEVLRLGWQGNIYDELVVDNFCGGGGASTGIDCNGELRAATPRDGSRLGDL